MPKAEQNLYLRGKIWWCKIELGGRKIHESTKETQITKAREWRDAARERLKKKRNGIKEDILYDDLMERFFEHCDIILKPKSVMRYEVSANACDQYLTGKLISEIGKAEVMEVLDARAKEVSGSSVNRDRSYLSALFSYAADRDMIEYNPVSTIKKMDEGQPRTRNFTRKEFEKIHSKLGKLHADMCEFATETGLRAEEIIYLEWPQIDLNGKEVKVVDTKAKKDRIVPLRPRALTILASQIRHTKTDLVFWHKKGIPFKTINKAFQKAAEEAEVKDATFHDLRRTFTCWRSREDKIPLTTLSKLLGHHSTAVTEKSYWFLMTDDLHESMGTVTKSPQSKRSAKQGKSHKRRGHA
jgi:integrase/recombinase XerD